MSDITLSAGIRANLLSLQNTTSMIEKTQYNLSTGKKVNTALDDPIAFFKSQSLSYRASDLSARKDSIVQGMQTITAADKGLSGIMDLVKSAQAKAIAASELDTKRAYGITGGGTAAIDTSLGLYSQNAWVIEQGYTLTDSDDFETFLDNLGYMELQEGMTGAGVSQSLDGTNGETAIKISYSLGATTTHICATLTWEEIAESADKTASLSTVTLNDVLNAMSSKFEGLTFEYDTEKHSVRVYAEDSSTTICAIYDPQGTFSNAFGINITGATLSGTVVSTDIGSELQSLQNNYNEILSQIDSLAEDSSYAGINLLNSDQPSNKLTVYFNENLEESSKLDVQGVNVTAMGLRLTTANWTGDSGKIDTSISETQSAQSTLRNASSSFATAASILNTRDEFTDNMVNTLETGSSELVNADMNNESANMLALQTRQQLGTISLSIANQSEQGVLRLF